MQSTGLWSIDFHASYEGLYRTQPWVYVVVNKLARAIARLPLHTFTLDTDTGDRERIREGTLPALLHRPYPRGSGMRLMEHLVASTAIYGNGLLVKRRPARGTPPTELWPLDWRRVQVFTAGSDMSPVDHYEYHTDAGAPEVLQPKDVVHLQWWGPEGIGVSPLEPLRFALGNESAATRYSTQSFTNSVRPSGALITPKRLSQQDRAEMRQEIEMAHAGAENSGRMLLLDNGLDWKAFGGSAADSQMVEVRKLNRDEVCAVYDIPPPMVGILDRATFSNIDEQHRMLYQDTLGPWLVLAEQTLGSQLVEPETGWAGLFCEFLLDDVLRGDIEKRPRPTSACSKASTPRTSYAGPRTRPVSTTRWPTPSTCP